MKTHTGGFTVGCNHNIQLGGRDSDFAPPPPNNSIRDGANDNLYNDNPDKGGLSVC